jgi:regulator of cell morphogenesis and NO signaling
MQTWKIDASTFVTDIVTHDYRAADIFRKYDIDFCCGGKWPLDMACRAKGLETEEILKELRRAMHHTASGAVPEFDGWSIDFLADYILNVHHRYLHKALPAADEYVKRFLEGHRKKYPELSELQKIMQRLMKEIPPHMKKEEEVIFPYIKQIYHAWRHRESYASLLVRTLRKPVEEVMQSEHETVGKQLNRMREITNHYSPPANACLTHKVTFSKLQELDNDLVQHIHLENNILFPKAIALEKELLQKQF